MRKLIVGIFLLVVALVIGVTQSSEFLVRATYGCQPVDKYIVKSNDSSSEEVNFDFQDNDKIVVITVDGGYTVTEVWLDVNGDGIGGFVKYGTTTGTYNPSGNDTVTEAKVRVVKTCPTPSPTPVVTPTPSPTTSPSPSPSPTPTSTPDPCEQIEVYKGDYLEIDPCEPESTPTPTPTPVPCEVTNTCPEQKSPPSTEPKAPVCSDGNTLQLPGNTHVIRFGEQATVNFFLTEGDSANIYYKEVNEGSWSHSVPREQITVNGDRFVSHVIHGLDPRLGYTFGVQQVKGCGGGQTVTAVVVDGPEPVTFPFSYWEWN